MRLKKPVALSLAVIAALLLLLAVLWLGARTGVARRAAGDYLGGLTGLPVTVGSLAIGFLPAPSVELGGLVIGQPPGFGAEPLLEAGSAQVVFPWNVVFGLDPVLRSVAMSDAKARLAVAADGTDNWSAVVKRISDLVGEGPASWSVRRLDLENCAVEFSDAAKGSQWRLAAITVGADTVAPAAEFPFELRLAGIRGPNTLHLAFTGHGLLDPDAKKYAMRNVTLRGWIGGEPLPLAGIELGGGLAVASFDEQTGIAAISGGTMTLVGMQGKFGLNASSVGPETRLDFSLATAPFAPRALATAFGHPLPATADPQAFAMLQFSVKGRLEKGELHLDPIEGQLDDTRWSGNAIPQLRLIRLHADRLDLDRYLAPDQKPGKSEKATIEAALAELGKLDIDAEIRIDEARVAGARLRDALLKVERNDGSPQ